MILVFNVKIEETKIGNDLINDGKNRSTHLLIEFNG